MNAFSQSLCPLLYCMYVCTVVVKNSNYYIFLMYKRNRAAFALITVTFIILFRKLRTTIKILEAETDVAIKTK
jgi:hypothetical protein